MYHCKEEVLKKIAHAKYDFEKLCKFRERIFVCGGLHERTGTYPLLAEFSSFLGHGRSVLHYALREAEEKGMKSLYDDYVGRRPIFGCLKDLRDTDVHECTLCAETEMHVTATIREGDRNSQSVSTIPFPIYVESLDDLDSPKAKNRNIQFVTTIGKKVAVTPQLLSRLECEGHADLAQAARGGQPLWEPIECDGERDLFKLCEAYLTQLGEFIQFGVGKGFIT